MHNESSLISEHRLLCTCTLVTTCSGPSLPQAKLQILQFTKHYTYYLVNPGDHPVTKCIQKCKWIPNSCYYWLCL